MSDIIKDARQLLDGATPGPWEWEKRSYKDDSECKHDWLGSEHGAALETTDSDEYASWVEASGSDKTLIAAAPELAQALAEETYEYAVQVKRGDGWEYTYESWDNRWQGSYSVQEVRAQRDHPGEETRIVRRRVSPPEVINE